MIVLNLLIPQSTYERKADQERCCASSWAQTDALQTSGEQVTAT